MKAKKIAKRRAKRAYTRRAPQAADPILHEMLLSHFETGNAMNLMQSRHKALGTLITNRLT